MFLAASRQRELLDALQDTHSRAPGKPVLPRPTCRATMAFLVAAAEAAGPEVGSGDSGWADHALARMCQVLPSFATYGSASLNLSLCKGVLSGPPHIILAGCTAHLFAVSACRQP
jgi:hypothetical protein